MLTVSHRAMVSKIINKQCDGPSSPHVEYVENLYQLLTRGRGEVSHDQKVAHVIIKGEALKIVPL